MIGEPSSGCAACHATSTELEPTARAYNPSAHGTKTLERDHAVPPHEPEHTRRLATSPPTSPRLPSFNTYATPSLPIASTTPSEGSTVAPTEPRSVSLSFSATHFDGAKYERTECRSGESWMTALL